MVSLATKKILEESGRTKTFNVNAWIKNSYYNNGYDDVAFDHGINDNGVDDNEDE